MRSLLLLLAAVWLAGCSTLGASRGGHSALQVMEVPGMPGIELTARIDGSALPGAIVTVSSGDVAFRESITDAVGKVQLNLAPGSWRVEVRLEGLRPAAGDLVVPRDARLEVVADLTVDMSCAIIIACPLAPGDRYLPAQYTFYNDGYAWPLPMR